MVANLPALILQQPPTVNLTKKWCLGPDCCGWREASIDFHAGYLAQWWIE